jgi:hypothetical protein
VDSCTILIFSLFLKVCAPRCANFFYLFFEKKQKNAFFAKKGVFSFSNLPLGRTNFLKKKLKKSGKTQFFVFFAFLQKNEFFFFVKKKNFFFFFFKKKNFFEKKNFF